MGITYKCFVLALMLVLLQSCTEQSDDHKEDIFPGLEYEKTPNYQDPNKISGCDEGSWKIISEYSDKAVRCYQSVWNNKLKDADGYKNSISCPDASIVVLSDDHKTAWCQSEINGIVFSVDGSPSRCEKTQEGLWKHGLGSAEISALRCVRTVWGNTETAGPDSSKNQMVCPFGTTAIFSPDRRIAACQGRSGETAMSVSGNVSRCTQEQEGTWSLLFGKEGQTAVRCFHQIWNSNVSSSDGQVNWISCEVGSLVKFSRDQTIGWCETAEGWLEYSNSGHRPQCEASEAGRWRRAHKNTSSANHAFKCFDGEWGGANVREFECPGSSILEIPQSGDPICKN